MPIYRLEPIDTDDPNWSASSYAADVYVRAPDERTARRAAWFQFRQAVANPSERLLDPWTSPEFVAASIVTDSAWPADGPTDILHPPDSNDRIEGLDLDKLGRL